MSFSPREYEVVSTVSARQGWTVSGWVGGLVEYVELLGPPPVALGLDEAAWWRCADRAESLRWAGEWMAGRGAGTTARDLVDAAERVERVCRARAVGTRERVLADITHAGRYAELRATQVGPGARECGGARRARAQIRLTRRTHNIVGGAGRRSGWTVGEWVATVAAAAAGWLTLSEIDEAESVKPLLDRLAVPDVLLTGEAGHAGQVEHLVKLAGWATGEVRAVEQGLLGVAANCSRTREAAVDGDARAVEEVLGWSGQLAVDVRPGRDDEANVGIRRART